MKNPQKRRKKWCVGPVRDLNLWEQPCFWIYQAPFHRCARCNYRQHIIPPFKRKDVSYTYRFEQFVLRSLIGSTAEEVARRLGISAETVDRIVENQLTEDRQIDPQRVITDIGLDELSLKKRHRLDVTLMTDLSDPTRPQILAVERGRDTTAALKCLDRLTQEQRQQVRTHRVDMGPAYPAACALRLPHSRAVTDRFHVAKKFNEVVDSLRKNITREYKAKLTKDQRKAFRSQMWAFRRDPASLKGVTALVPGIMRLFWAFSSSNPPESPSQEDSSLANMLDTLEARCRSDGPPAGPRSIDPLPGSRSFLTVSAVA